MDSGKNSSVEFVVQRALNLIGISRTIYACNQVVNECLFDNKNCGMSAKDYLKWGVEVDYPSAGNVVVGKDGNHCGIFINGTEFIHSSSSKIIKVGLDQLKWVFPNGYEFRDRKN